MATTSIMPLHTGKGRSVRRAIQDSINYVKNPAKTDEGRLVTSYQCNGEIADAEFLLAKRQYIAAPGRIRGKDDIIAYHLRRSFVPGEITPEEANRLGQELARRFTKGNHAFVVCTHIDKAHVHNHIIWNAVNLDCDRKVRNFLGSSRAGRRLSFRAAGQCFWACAGGRETAYFEVMVDLSAQPEELRVEYLPGQVLILKKWQMYNFEFFEKFSIVLCTAEPYPKISLTGFSAPSLSI